MARIIDRNAKVNAYYVSPTTGDRHKVAEGIPYYLLDKLVPLLTQKYAITMKDIEVRPADVTQYTRSSQPELAEGIFDRFKKKPAQPEVADPGNYPRIGSDIAQWMADTVEYHKAKFPDTVWKLFCPTYPDYLPVRVRVGTSEKIMHQHLDDYINLRNQNPEAVRIARQKFDKNNIYPNGPRDDYTNKVVDEAYDGFGKFDAAEFQRHMEKLRAREELRKTDPMRALVGDLKDQDAEKELAAARRKKPEDDSFSINDPRHPGYAYTQMGQPNIDEALDKTSLAQATVNALQAVLQQHPEWVKQYGAKEVKRVTKYVTRGFWEAMNQDDVNGIVQNVGWELIASAEENLDEGWKEKATAAALAASMASNPAHGGAVSVAGAIPTPSHQAAMYKAAADSNRAEAKRQAELKAKQDAERLEKNTEIVDREQRINHHKLDEFAPGNGDDDRPTKEYEVYQCNPQDQFDWIGGPLMQTDDMGKAHSFAYFLWKKYPDKCFMIWQERSQGSRGGYGPEGSVLAPSEEVDEGYIFKGGFPFDVDHMPGSVIRNRDETTDIVKTKNKDKWDDMVDIINDEVFDDMSDFRTNSEGETVTGNSAVWAKWDNRTQTGWINRKGQPLKPWPVKENEDYLDE